MFDENKSFTMGDMKSEKDAIFASITSSFNIEDKYAGFEKKDRKQ